jgi:DNA topoisomerase-1
MKLLIIESPGKQKTIQSYLGASWRVVASLGHIRSLEQSLDFLKNDFEPKYEFLKEKVKAIKDLKEAAGKADDIYLAADKDFEGEQIAYSVCLLLKLNPKTAKRVTFTEITEKAILHAIEHPGVIDMDKVHTQKARAVLDMLIGFTMSPLLWRYVAPSLSAGRCQTPALRLVVEREKLIDTFQATSSWHLSGIWQHHQTGFSFDAHMEDELEDEESAMNYMENIHGMTEGTIQSKDIRPWSEKAPEPLITSTLQQQASALFHINPKNAMKIAQRLYEGGHITYMRTDKAVLSEDAVAEAKKWITEHYGKEYVSNGAEVGAKKQKTSKKVAGNVEEVKAQEAHEAIRPTHMEVTELPEGDWSAVDKKIYRLIWQRTIQSVMSPARGELCKVKLQILDDDFTWSSSWKRTLFEGWKLAGKVISIDADSESEEEFKEDVWENMMMMKVGDNVHWKEIKAEPKETKAQGRFTEATLVRELEKYGIGRPSTFASLLSVIQEKGYVEMRDIPPKEVKVKEYTLHPRKWPALQKDYQKKVGAEKGKLVPTDLGRSVLDFMLQHFQDLFDYGFTAQMEKRLDKIAEGEESWKQVLRDMWNSYKDRYEDLLSKQSLGKKTGDPSAKVKEFSGGLKAVQSKKGPLLLIEGAKKEDTVFLGWPSGVRFDDMTEEIARTFQAEVNKKKEGSVLGEWKGIPIMKKTGKFGEYLQCGETSIPYQAGEDLVKMMERLETKANGGSGIIRQFKEFVIRTGPYGPYIMKTSLKKPQFVSLPKEVDGTKLTEKEVDVLYKAGLEAKKKVMQWKGGKKT